MSTHLVSDQGTHFINRTIEILTQESTTYYAQRNDQTKSTNKTLGRLLAKMVNANQNDWDFRLFTAIWAYQIAYKVTTHTTPFELVYALNLLCQQNLWYLLEMYQKMTVIW